jgi:hypothetical protein
VDVDPEVPGAREWTVAIAWVGVLAVAVIPAFFYLRVYSGRPIHVSGSDAFGYAWQIRAIGTSSLRNIGSRPGAAALGAILQGLRVLPDPVAPPVLGLAAGVSLGLCAAAIVRIAFRLAGWQIGVIAAFVTLWTGTARMGSGYLANLISLVAFVAALAIVLADDRPKVSAGSVACALASGLIHPVFLAVYGGICLVWALFSLTDLTRRREGTGAARGGGPIEALTAVLCAGVVVAVVMLVLLKIHVRDIFDLQVGQLGERLVQSASRTFSTIAVVTIGLGIAVIWLARGGRDSGRVSRLGVGWLAVCLGGALIGAVHPSFPGHRALMVALPLPVASGLGAAGVIAWASRARRTLVKFVAVSAATVAALAAIVLFAHPSINLYRGPTATPTSMAVLGYVTQVRPTVPVVVVMQPADLGGILLWKARFNEPRAFAPVDQIGNIVGYIGRPDQALAGRQTLIADPSGPAAVAFNRVSKHLWADYGSQVADPTSILLVPKDYVSPNIWDGLVATSRGLAAPDLAVLRGPVPQGLRLATPPTLPVRSAWLYTILTVLALGLAGGGFAFRTTASRGATSLDAVALAPALGVVVLTLTGLAVAAVGLEPHGAAGVAAATIAALLGYAFAFGPRVRIRLRRRAG